MVILKRLTGGFSSRETFSSLTKATIIVFTFFVFIMLFCPVNCLAIDLDGVVESLESRRQGLMEGAISFRRTNLISIDAESTETFVQKFDETDNLHWFDPTDVPRGLEVISEYECDYFYSTNADHLIKRYIWANVSHICQERTPIPIESVTSEEFILLWEEFASDGQFTRVLSNLHDNTLHVYPKEEKRLSYMRLFEFDYSLAEWHKALTEPPLADQNITVTDSNSEVIVLFHRDTRNWDVTYTFTTEFGFALNHVISVLNGLTQKEIKYGDFRQIASGFFVPFAQVQIETRASEKGSVHTISVIEVSNWTMESMTQDALEIPTEKYNMLYDHSLKMIIEKEQE